MMRRLMLNGFWWPSSTEVNSRQSRDLSGDSLIMLFASGDIRCHIMIASIQLFIKTAELIKVLIIIISNQMSFSQLVQKLPLKLTDKQIQWLLRYVVKQDFNLISQSCELHSENRELIIILHTKSFSFFYISLTLQMILIVVVKITE